MPKSTSEILRKLKRYKEVSEMKKEILNFYTEIRNFVCGGRVSDIAVAGVQIYIKSGARSKKHVPLYRKGILQILKPAGNHN